MTTAAALDALRSVDLDAEVPCAQEDIHARHGTGPAVWMVRLSCRCTEVRQPMCDGCLRFVRRSVRPAACGDCGKWTWPMRRFVVRADPL